MNATLDRINAFMESPPQQVNRDEMVSLQTGWTSLGGSIEHRRSPNRQKKGIRIQQNKTSDAYSGRRIQVMAPQPIEQDTFLDNDVGDTIRNIKENFGDVPLIDAYEAALDISKESDKKWKEYWKEEARLQSLFEGD